MWSELLILSYKWLNYIRSHPNFSQKAVQHTNFRYFESLTEQIVNEMFWFKLSYQIFSIYWLEEEIMKYFHLEKINDWKKYLLSLTNSIASDIRSFCFECFMNKINITVIIRASEEILISFLNKICKTRPYFHLPMFFRYAGVIRRFNYVVK